MSYVTCPECNGSGSNKGTCQHLDESGQVEFAPIQCPVCDGKGEIFED
ncbi:hypothetical protein [Vibrio genomosp. F6]|nr:hypothetical protein [Vibrio genomosp. F6]